MRSLIDKLYAEHTLTKPEWLHLLQKITPEDREYLRSLARSVADEHFGNRVYIRGLIEMTNYCRNDCLYCGIRKSNCNAERYRLSQDEILACCAQGYTLGFRTFVLQGGDDPWFNDDRLSSIVAAIHTQFPDCAITLSVGEKTPAQYLRFQQAGADRYLLRHETADINHYAQLHPDNMSGEERKRCLWELKQMGYQTGAGFMVGSPYQTDDQLAEDLLFLEQLQPHMVGIGPFIPHADTPFAQFPAGTIEQTLLLLSLVRLLLPKALLPATTALGTIHPKGREMGILAGANVVMPNLSPVGVRKKYALYNNKICTGEEAAECMNCLSRRMESIGYQLVVDRGDHAAAKEERKGIV